MVKSCLEYLEHKGIFAWRNNSGGFKKGKHFIRFGAVGSPDILGIMPNGQALCIECKVGKNVTSEAQMNWLSVAKKQGALVLIVYTIDELINSIEP